MYRANHTMINVETGKIINELRKNSRQSLVTIGETTNIPQSTVYDKVKSLEESVIKKYTCLLDYQKLGYGIEIKMAFKISNEQKVQGHEQILSFIKQHKNINNAFHINHDFDFFIECVFENYGAMYDFLNELKEKFGVEKQEVYHILHDIKHEEFLTTI